MKITKLHCSARVSDGPDEDYAEWFLFDPDLSNRLELHTLDWNDSFCAASVSLFPSQLPFFKISDSH